MVSQLWDETIDTDIASRELVRRAALMQERKRLTEKLLRLAQEQQNYLNKILPVVQQQQRYAALPLEEKGG